MRPETMRHLAEFHACVIDNAITGLSLFLIYWSTVFRRISEPSNVLPAGCSWLPSAFCFNVDAAGTEFSRVLHAFLGSLLILIFSRAVPTAICDGSGSAKLISSAVGSSFLIAIIAPIGFDFALTRHCHHTRPVAHRLQWMSVRILHGPRQLLY